MCGFGILISNVIVESKELIENPDLEPIKTALEGQKSVEPLAPEQEKEIFSQWKETLIRRGPDALEEHRIDVSSGKLHFIGSILHIRGPKPVPQPIILGKDVLVFNGEIFKGIDCDDQSDTFVLSSLLQQCTNEEEIMCLMNKLHGPWAFAYWKESLKTLFFGRDKIGRRSILISIQNGYFGLSSIDVHGFDNVLKWTDLPTTGIYTLTFRNSEKDIGKPVLSCFPWHVSKNQDTEDKEGSAITRQGRKEKEKTTEIKQEKRKTTSKTKKKSEEKQKNKTRESTKKIEKTRKSSLEAVIRR